MIGVPIFVGLAILFWCKLAHTMDLVEAYEKAKRHDPKYQAVYFEQRALKTLPKQALANLLPQINLSYSNMRYEFSKAPIYYLDYTSRTTSVSLTQPLLNLPSLTGYRQEKLRANTGDYKLSDAEQDLIRRLVSAYLDVLYYREVLKAAEEEKIAVEEHLRAVKKLFAAGEATIADVNDAEARYSSILYKLLEVEKLLYSAKNNLSRIVGEEVGDLLVLTEDIDFTTFDLKDLEYWVRLAKEENNIVKRSALGKDIAKLEIRRQTFEHFPKVDFVAGYTFTNTNNYLKTQETGYYIFGIQVRLNLFSGGYITAKRAEALERYKQAEKEYDSVVSDVVQQVTENYYGARSALAQIYYGQVALRSAEVARASTKRGYEAGIRTVIDVLNSESEYYKAKVNLAKAKHEFLKYFINLRYFSGLLGEEDVKILNTLLTRK